MLAPRPHFGRNIAKSLTLVGISPRASSWSRQPLILWLHSMRILNHLDSRTGPPWPYTSLRCPLLGECCFTTCFRRSSPVPTYEYECSQCERHHEVFQNFSDDPLVECPDCSGKLTKVFHPAGVIFKGGGWYVTDSRSGSEKKKFTDDGKSPSPSEDSKPVKSDGKGEKSSQSTSENKSDKSSSKKKAVEPG